LKFSVNFLTDLASMRSFDLVLHKIIFCQSVSGIFNNLSKT
jgi:hypothetical protein